MKIVSFNTNGIRARPHQLLALRENYDPDVIGIQETKVQDAEFPGMMVEEIGFQSAYHGQKGHYGVALLSKTEPVSIQKGFPSDEDNAQRRLIVGTFKTTAGQEVTVINGYFPQGENSAHETKYPNKCRFYADLMCLLNDQFSPEDYLVVMGDMNIAPHDADIGIGAANAKRWLREGKCCFLPEEREWLQTLMDWGLHDTFRALHPEVDDSFSWFDYRSRGFEQNPQRGLRIDMILATKSLANLCTDAGIAYDIRSMEKPSDHCPIWAMFDV
ncbi:Exodeoxyribonuclease III [hydrothermal vent metagenome]|uniref:Exodeoxyribonuclease III n=1 Tax=hydrothermal vent metagenome TaxID=652676 RepID=A0A3B1AR62_9ZZZZ